MSKFIFTISFVFFIFHLAFTQVLQDPSFENYVSCTAPSYDNFTGSYQNTVVWNNSIGSAGIFINGGGCSNIPNTLTNSLNASNGNVYAGIHSSGNFTQEVMIQTLTGNLIAGDVYDINADAYQMNLSVVNGIFSNPGRVAYYGVTPGTVLTAANQGSIATLNASVGIDLLGESPLINSTTAWQNFNITFTAANNYDRILIAINGTNSFIGIDNFSFVNNPLPVELLDFQAEMIDNRWVDLAWQTASETNNDYFIIDRSTDLVNWEFITTVPGSGNSLQQVSYSTKDMDPYEGVSYYRLTQVDFNGENTDGGVRSVSMMAYPNPTQGILTIYGSSDELHQLKLFNSIGQQVQLNVIEIKSNTLVVDISNVSAGVYFLKKEDHIYKVTKE